MLLSPIIRNITSLWLRLSEHCFQKSAVKNSISCRYCATCEYSKESGASPSLSESTSTCSDSADIFGSLRRPKSVQKTKPVGVKVVRVKNKTKFNRFQEANVFGNLSDKNPIWYPEMKKDPIIDNDQSDDSTIVRNISNKFRSPTFYLERMKLLVAEKKLKEALDLFVDMRRNFVTPLHAHFTFMIGACGKVGYTEMAFKLLRQLTDRGFPPTSATLTGLFNSCGESPFPEYGLMKALKLKEKIQMKNWKLNQITYHAMIKAFGRCGDIQMAFQIVDEMAEADIKIDAVTYNFLLMSCITNKESGFTHAIEVWRKMKERRCIPNNFSFNLLLRTARDCEVGPEEISCLLLQHWSSYSKRPYGFKVKNSLPKKELLHLNCAGTVDILPDTDGKPSCQQKNMNVIDDSENPKSYENMPKSLLEKKTKNSAIVNAASGVPSVLNARPINGAEVLEIALIKTSSDRLALIGGAQGVLFDMKNAKLKPNIKTFTLLLECLPPTTEAEEELLSLLEDHKVTPDIGFFNVLIKRRSFRFDYTAAQKVLLLVNKWSLTPDLITFGVLALGCCSHTQASIFVNDMRKLGISPNIEIIGALISSACSAVDFDYLQNTLKLMEEEGIEPNEKMLSKIEVTLKNTRKNILDMEHGKSVPNIYKKEGLSRRYKDFCEKYDQWLKKMKFSKEEHVWTQYKTEIVDKYVELPYNTQNVE